MWDSNTCICLKIGCLDLFLSKASYLSFYLFEICFSCLYLFETMRGYILWVIFYFILFFLIFCKLH